MLRITWKKFGQPAIMLLHSCMLAGFVILYSGCAASNRGGDYQPPRLGAEYRFEDGLKKEKKPQYLFSKKEREGMEKMGLPSGKNTAPGGGESPAPGGAASTDSSKTSPVATPATPATDTMVYKVLPKGN